jgi:hypothetical protein
VTEQTELFTARLAEIQGPRNGIARLPMLVGSLLAPLGVVLIVLGWLGAAHTPILQEEIAYGLSGGLVGLALVVVGSFLYFSHWQTQQIRETRAQTFQLSGELQSLQSALALLVSSLIQGQPALLVATRSGTLSHRPDCSVVRSRADLKPARADLSPCHICQPV